VDLRTVHDMLGHASIVLTADTYISVVPELARDAAEKIAALILGAGCLIPGTRKRRRDTGKTKDRRSTRRPSGRRSRAHPARQLGRPAAATGPGPLSTGRQLRTHAGRRPPVSCSAPAARRLSPCGRVCSCLT